MPDRFRRNNSGLVEKAVDEARGRVAAEQYSRFADPIRQAPDRSEHRRQRLRIVEVENQRARSVDEQQAIVIPQRDGEDRDTLAYRPPFQWCDELGAVSLSRHVSEVATLGQRWKEIYRSLAEPTNRR